MKTHSAPPVEADIRLTRQDIIESEHALKDAIRSFLPFSTYSIFFQGAGAAPADEPEPEYRREDAELLLPLCLDGEMFGWFVARGARLAAPKAALPLMARLTSGVLRELCLQKRVVTDPLTGLYNREHFSRLLVREIDRIKACLLPTASQAVDADMPSFSGCLGLILLDLDCFQRINENYGYATGDRIVTEVGGVIRTVCPKQVSAARLTNDTFALLLPDAKNRDCFKLAERIREAVATLTFTDDVTGDVLRVSASLGTINYPQGLSGRQLKRSDREQSRMLLRKARKAVGEAKDQGRDRVFAFSDIVKNGGRVLEILPMNRLSVSLGRSVDAQEGQRFLVRSPKYQKAAEARLTEEERLIGRYPTMYKGEIVLTEVQDEMAFAEILHLGDPAWSVEAGDRLSLVQEKESFFEAESAADLSGSPQKDMVTGLYPYRDFLASLTRARQKPQRFSLTLLRILEQPKERLASFQAHMDGLTAKVAALAESMLGPEAMGGRFGLNGLAFFMADRDHDEVGAAVAGLVGKAAADLDIELAAGTAHYPCLAFGRADMLENARKALEHAQLLPPPMVAVFDSVSLNVAADKLYMDGDIYGAVEEFKLALLADEDNVVARNSLGICLAQLGRLEQARRHFELVIKAEPGNIMAHYNLGWTCQRLGEGKKARECFRRCLKLDPNHVFSLIRLGSMAEREGRLAEAEKQFAKAAALPGAEALTMRHLARVCLARGDADKAREYLHLALNANHNDAQALHLLAKLYLDQGEDPQIAEVLARQSAALSPDREEYWQVLIKSLEAQGKKDEMQKIEARAR